MTVTTPVALAFGAIGGFIEPAKQPTHREFLPLLRKYGVGELDTARAYGDSEEFIGNEGLAKEFTITTKAPTGFQPGNARKEEILANAKLSFDLLKVDKVRVYFLHGQDDSVPIEEQVDAIQELYKEGRFEKFGLSNFTCEAVLNVYNYAKSKNYVLPTVYQSNYSLVGRKNETLLFPTLRSLNFSIQAYSPIAGGFLTKTPAEIENGGTKGGRWDRSTFLGKLFHALYNKPSFLKMLEEYGKLAEESGVGKAGMAYRWVRYHSALKGEFGDMMIIGASSPKQLEETLGELEKGPLDEKIVERLEELWKMVEPDAVADNLEVAKKLGA